MSKPNLTKICRALLEQYGEDMLPGVVEAYLDKFYPDYKYHKPSLHSVITTKRRVMRSIRDAGGMAKIPEDQAPEPKQPPAPKPQPPAPKPQPAKPRDAPSQVVFVEVRQQQAATNDSPTINDLHEVSSRCEKAGVSPEEMNDRLNDLLDMAAKVGGMIRLGECLHTIIGIQNFLREQ